MSITNNFTHKLEDDFEQYAFKSALHPRQTHFIDRDLDGPWQLSLVDHHDPFTLEEAQILRREFEDLCRFMDGLNRPKLHRTTEPGSPDLAGRGGGL